MNNTVFDLLKSLKKFKYRLIAEGVLIGVFAGLITAAYRFVLAKTEVFSKWIYSSISGNIPLIVLAFAVLVILGIVCGFLIKSEPMIKGSGIPQVEGTVMGHFNPCWYKVLIKKFVGGVIAIGAGLSLGREGPSIQLGASCGQGVSRMLRRGKFEEKYLITSGASAGLAAAFNAPFAGVMFALEEVHKSFSPDVLLSAMTAAITGDLVSKLIFGTSPVFSSTTYAGIMPLSIYPFLCVFGIILGLFGAFYNNTLLKTQDLYAKLSMPDRLKPVIPFVLAGILGLTFPIVLGGGHGIIEGLIEDNFALSMILLILVIKFVFSMISFCSGTPGGIFFPLLVLGALTGGIFAKVGIMWLGLPAEFWQKFILIGMVGMFTGIVRAPITGIILIIEMSGSLSQMLSLSVVAVFAYITAELCGAKPIYDSLLERMVKPEKFAAGGTVAVRVNVTAESGLGGSTVKELELPERCLVASVERLGEEIIPSYSTALAEGDKLVIICKEIDEDLLRQTLKGKRVSID